jgi:3-phenylpropionate/trans-cinnamate dioxygenase ferredoxin reductase subunit
LGIHTLRSRDDVDRIVESLPSVTEVVIVGGGYVGLEAAASLIKQKKSVTVVEAHDRVLSRVAGPLLSQFFEDQHRAQGVNVKLGQTVTALDGKNGMVCGVRLASGERVPAQLVIVGIGIEPSVEPLLAAGAEGGDGVRVDGRCRTSLDNVYAIGDCALHANIFADGREIRLESVQNAQDMATTAARDIVGEALRESVAPWFWSFQYDLRLQSVGLSAGHDSTLTRGSLENRQFSIVYLKAGHVVALDCVNATRDFIDGRAWVQNRVCETMVNGAQACK